MLSRISAWLVSQQGRNAAVYSIGGLGSFLFGLYVSPHYWFLDKHREFVQMYKLGVPVSPSPEVESRAKEVFQDMNMPEDKQSAISLFTMFGFDVYHAGSTELRGGAIIGIPLNFSYKNTSDFETSQLSFMERDVEFSWSSPNGKKLLDSLLYSKNAQKFAIAREVSYINTNYVYAKAFNATVSFTTTYMFGRYINLRLDLYSRLRRQRLVLYGLVSCVGFMFYLILSDLLDTYYDAYVDKNVAKLGKDYITGGIEYYEKLLARNKVIRSALGSKGESNFTAHGNINELIRVSQIPISARLDDMKDNLKEFESA